MYDGNNASTHFAFTLQRNFFQASRIASMLNLRFHKLIRSLIRTTRFLLERKNIQLFISVWAYRQGTSPTSHAHRRIVIWKIMLAAFISEATTDCAYERWASENIKCVCAAMQRRANAQFRSRFYIGMNNDDTFHNFNVQWDDFTVRNGQIRRHDVKDYYW
jgi:hypothetical protein